MHRHRYAEHARTWAPPSINTVTEFEGDPAVIERLLAGVTTFVFRCADESCADLKKIECLGRVKEAPQP